MNDETSHTWTDIYEYYYRGGLIMMILDGLASLIIGMMISSFPIIIFGCCDFSKLDSTTKLTDFISSFPVGWKRTPILIKICSIIFYSFNVIQLLQILIALPRFISLKKYYSNKLGIPDSDLAVIEWNDVVESVLLNDSRQKVSVLEIAQEILCYDNYMCAIVSDPSILTWKLPFQKSVSYYPMSRFFFYLLQLALTGTVLDKEGRSLVNGAQSIRSQHIATQLQFRFRFIGVILFIISPFVLAFQLLYLFFHYAQAIRNSPDSLSLRRWTPHAKWILREFNEYPHIFKKRIASSYLPANMYLNQFPSTLLQPVARTLAFISGAIICSIFVIGVYSDIGKIMNVVIFGDKTAAWLLAILATIYAVCHSITYIEPQLLTPEDALSEVEKQLHYDFKDKTNSPISWKTQQNLSEFFQPIWRQMIQELFSFMTNPFIFTFCLPFKANSIVDFIRTHSTQVNEIGWISSFSAFDEDGDHKFGGSPGQRDKLRRSMANFDQRNFVPEPNPLLESFDNDLFIQNSSTPSRAESPLLLESLDRSHELQELSLTPENFLADSSLI